MNEIFLDDKLTILTNAQENIENEKYSRLRDVNLDEVIEALSHKGIDRIYLYHPKAEEFMKEFKQPVSTIKAGDGIVYNQEGKVLLIKRNGRWDLPKGKKKKGGNIVTYALRKVEEETGIKKLFVQCLRTIAYHIFKYDKQYLLKETYWCDVIITYKKKLVPRTEGGVEKVCWKDEATAKELAKSSYKSMQLVFSR